MDITGYEELREVAGETQGRNDENMEIKTMRELDRFD